VFFFKAWKLEFAACYIFKNSKAAPSGSCHEIYLFENRLLESGSHSGQSPISLPRELCLPRAESQSREPAPRRVERSLIYTVPADTRSRLAIIAATRCQICPQQRNLTPVRWYWCKYCSSRQVVVVQVASASCRWHAALALTLALLLAPNAPNRGRLVTSRLPCPESADRPCAYRGWRAPSTRVPVL
jgi:hypothetical protein